GERGHGARKGGSLLEAQGQAGRRNDAPQRLDLVNHTGLRVLGNVPDRGHVGHEQGALGGQEAVQVADAGLAGGDEVEIGARVQVDVGDRVLVVGGSPAKETVEADEDAVVEPGRVTGGSEGDFHGAGDLRSRA